MAMTESQLARYADSWLLDNYGMRLVVPLKLNGRLRTTLGWFIYKKKAQEPVAVHLNKQFVKNNEKDIVLNVLKHELMHYALFMKGEPHSDGDSHFENELKKKGIVSQATVNNYTIMNLKQIYQCVECNKIFTLTKRLKNNGRNHECQCTGKLIDRGKRVVTT